DGDTGSDVQDHRGGRRTHRYRGRRRCSRVHAAVHAAQHLRAATDHRGPVHRQRLAAEPRLLAAVRWSTDRRRWYYLDHRRVPGLVRDPREHDSGSAHRDSDVSRLQRERVAHDAVASTQASAVEYRPTDVVPQPLVVEYDLANRVRELVVLPPALASPGELALSFRGSSACGLDRIGGGTEVVRRDVCDGRGLAGSVGGMPWCPSQVSGRGICVAGRSASLGHRDLAAHPAADLIDRLARSRVLRLSRLEEIEDVLRARCRPQGEQLVIRIGERPTAADRYETTVAVL